MDDTHVQPIKARLIFHNLTKRQKDHLKQAQQHLAFAGVHFTSHYEASVSSYVWELDTLKGAVLVEKEY